MVDTSVAVAAAPRPRLTYCVVPVRDLPADRVARMYQLYAAHYEACSPARFEADLAGKHLVILLLADGVLAGFSTVAHERFVASTGPVRVLFSGDTIIDRNAWGDQALARGFAQLAGTLHAQAPQEPLYWLLISKGHRTYRYLGLFARHFFPHPAGDDPALRQLACEIASARFGADFNPDTGVITFAESHGHLRPELADVPERIAARPEGALFLSRNPGWQRGDELVCLTRLHPDNLRAVVHTAFLQGQRDGLEGVCHD